jgi:hypothetical protein
MSNRQPTLKQEWVQTTANAAGTNGLTCLRSTEELEIINFGHPSHNWPFRNGHRAVIIFRSTLFKIYGNFHVEIVYYGFR